MAKLGFFGHLVPAFVFATVMPLAAMAQETPTATGPAVSPEAPWVKLCNADPNTKKELCLVIQELRADTGQFIASATIRQITGDPKRSFIAAVPPGMLLQPGLRAQIDAGKQYELTIIGDLHGCRAMSTKGRCGIYNVMSSKTRRKELRNKGTKAEAILWKQLKDRQLGGAKFRRQHGLGRYIVDFFCPEFRVVVELDGGGHELEEQIKYDRERTKYLESLGIRVVRFSNWTVIHEMDLVLETILGIIHP